MEELLRAEKVSYTYVNKYRKVKAVQDVSCQFEAGHFYAITGKSGSGKSTLLSLLAGLMLPDAGSVRFEGESTKDRNLDEYRRDKVSVIFQSFNLFPFMTVLENVMYPLLLKKLPKRQAAERAAEKLKAVGLSGEYLKRFPDMLSGGEQQRVAIARALASGSRVILADEPTGNLDSDNGRNVIDILHGLAGKEGYCIIVVTHDDAIAKSADALIRLQDGRIVEGDVYEEH
ncbi:MAG: ABC transporter ATP-binding protein [Lachnospiraceae bacterium]|nr:ABC transporter ATP-binding protein [Lachnospiraceae bacterium]